MSAGIIAASGVLVMHYVGKPLTSTTSFEIVEEDKSAVGIVMLTSSMPSSWLAELCHNGGV